VLGNKVRELRNDRKLSQHQLANLADIMISQVSRIERGEINATISTVCALAAALKVDLNTLVPASSYHLLG
jgi:transcriptional regulator with XRE-family HTH domain